jgi:hypothetical protein
MVAQPFADFTWRHARRIAAGRGMDDTNETAVAAVLGALLRRAGNGPESSRVLAQQRRWRPCRPRCRARPSRRPCPLPPALPALPAAAADSGGGDPGGGEDREVTGTVVGFGLFDPFGGDRGNRR